MEISYIQPLSRAFERMSRILLRPFDLVKWLVLGFSAWLANLANGGAGGRPSWRMNANKVNYPEIASGLERSWQRLVEHAIWIPLILLGAAVVLAVLILLLWLSSRAKFIFLDNVVHDRAAIVEPWGRFRRLGNSLFLWRLGFTAAFLAATLLVVAAVLVPAAATSPGAALRGLSIAAIVAAVLVMICFAVVAAYVLLFLENFVIPIMYRFDLSATAAWRAFLPWLRRHGAWFVLYGLFVLALAIPVVVAYALLVCCTCCIVALPYVGTVILLPLWVTYRSLGPEFLAQLDESFDLFRDSEASQP